MCSDLSSLDIRVNAFPGEAKLNDHRRTAPDVLQVLWMNTDTLLPEAWNSWRLETE
jgi:hypothetical protein